MPRVWSAAAFMVGVGTGAALIAAVRSPGLRNRARSLTSRGEDVALPTHIELPAHPIASGAGAERGWGHAIEEGITAGSAARARAGEAADAGVAAPAGVH